MYTIKTEYLDLYGPDATEDTILTHEQVEYLASDWEKPVLELVDELEPYNYRSAVELMDDDIREALYNDDTERSEARFLWDYEIKHLEKYGKPFEY